MLGMQELIIILLICVLIFGSKRIPEIMSGLGKGINSFKKAVDGQDAPADPPVNHNTADSANSVKQSEAAEKKAI